MQALSVTWCAAARGARQGKSQAARCTIVARPAARPAAAQARPCSGSRRSARLTARNSLGDSAADAVAETSVPTEVLEFGAYAENAETNNVGGDGPVGGDGGMGPGGSGGDGGAGEGPEEHQPVAATLNPVVAFCCLCVGLTASSSIMKIAGARQLMPAPLPQHLSALNVILTRAALSLPLSLRLGPCSPRCVVDAPRHRRVLRLPRRFPRCPRTVVCRPQPGPLQPAPQESRAEHGARAPVPVAASWKSLTSCITNRTLPSALSLRPVRRWAPLAGHFGSVRFPLDRPFPGCFAGLLADVHPGQRVLLRLRPAARQRALRRPHG